MNFKQKLAYTALGGILIFMGMLMSHTFSGDVTAQWQQGDPPANITASEYLWLVFDSNLSRISLIADSAGLKMLQPYVFFSHSGEVSQGVVYVVLEWPDEHLNQLDLRRNIRIISDGYLNKFEILQQWVSVQSRWSPSEPRSHFVIRHVRYSDIQETLAVTLNGETSFESVKFWEAKRRVENSGGIWSAVK